jgi:nucleotide-binding universal stress UspA family protein
MESVWRPWLDERESDQVKLQARATQVESLLASSTIPHRVSEAYTELFHIDNIVGQEARYADLTIVGPEMLRDPAVRDAVIDGALFHENVPVLLLPDECIGTAQPENIVIAWNDSSAAAHAVRQGRSMLSSARQVTIALVDPDDEVRKSASDLSDFLQRSNVGSRISVLKSNGLTIEETLQEYAREGAADLMMMGAYGHSRLRERIFGGVTRAVIENPECPIFLAR